ncbi:hypothetical protein FB45DRAFT_1063914 [Roridomyces roridus]|uniref:Uncharacterized protein n=1 Tax=Roridomyces roridus TaxID=1738132 RepID=A0AAD7FF58_9AGAR|nr:hypothetical protein FB45DRAFT_1063914 [Roridomyces roridus]
MPSAMFPPTPELPGSSSVPPSAPSSRPGSVASISSFSISSISSSTSVPPSTTVSPAPASWDPDAAYETYRAKVQSATCARDFHEIMDSLIETGAHNYYDSLAIATLVTRVEALIEAHIPGGGGGQAYRADLRYRAFAAFQAHWTGDETAPWTSEPPLSPRYLSTSRGANLAAFIGSLFSVGVLTGSDVHYCLDTLVDIRDHPMYTSSPHVSQFIPRGILGAVGPRGAGALPGEESQADGGDY